MSRLLFESVSKAFDGEMVVRDVSFRLSAGEVVGLIGDNGAGKTTLLRLAAKLLNPSSGRVTVMEHAEAVVARAHLGALIERAGHYDELTVLENLRFFLSFYGGGVMEREAAVEMAITTCGLWSVKEAQVSTLSTGYRQRLAVARATHPWAQVILLDEPFESLDPLARHDIKQVLRERTRRGAAILISSHTLSDLAGLSDRLLVLAEGATREYEGFEHMAREVGLSGASDLDAVYARLRRGAGGEEARVH
ncbi:MAG: ABC transporter ATP-binding protein [Vicinamibacterales bacterium]|nr:ABC transporter ATP-binding protein [Vicinamibacterales bacterium]